MQLKLSIVTFLNPLPHSHDLPAEYEAEDSKNEFIFSISIYADLPVPARIFGYIPLLL
jgi:hypothetical protein